MVETGLTVWGEAMSAQMWDDRLRLYFRPEANTTTTAEYEIPAEDVESLRLLLNAAHARLATPASAPVGETTPCGAICGLYKCTEAAGHDGPHMDRRTVQWSAARAAERRDQEEGR